MRRVRPSGPSLTETLSFLYADGVNLLRANPRREPTKRAQTAYAESVASRLADMSRSYAVDETERSPGAIDFHDACGRVFDATDELLRAARSDSERRRGEVANGDQLARYHRRIVEVLTELSEGYAFGDE